MHKTLLFLAISPLAFGALTSSVQWDVRTTGNDSNGGGFDPLVTSPGTDYSQQNSPQITYTDLVIGTTTTQYTSVLNAVTSAIVGNIIHITGGTGCTTGWFEIISETAGTPNFATVDRSLGTAASICTANLGGSMLTVCGTYSSGCTAGAMSIAVSFNAIWVKSGTYSLGSTTIHNVSAVANILITVEGYNTTHGDYGTQPVFTVSGNVPVFIPAGVISQNIGLILINLNIATSNTSFTNCLINGFTNSAGPYLVFHSTFDLTTTTGSGANGACFKNAASPIEAEFYQNEFKLCSACNAISDDNGNNGMIVAEWNYIHGGTYGVWDDNDGANQRWLLKHNVFSGLSRGVYQQGTGGMWIEAESNSFYNITNECVRIGGSAVNWITAANNILYGCTYGFFVNTSAPAFNIEVANAFGNIGTANYNGGVGVWGSTYIPSPGTPGSYWNSSDISLGGCNPFNNPGSGDFTLSSCGKTNLGTQGYPGSTTFGLGKLAVGALQPASSSTGSAPHAFVQ